MTSDVGASFDRRVLVCVGTGGVGKTSVASALGVTLARQGHRVLALTVDPAGRLADSLGVDRKSSEPHPLGPEQLTLLGIAAPGSLSVAVLDATRTLTELVERLAPDRERRDRITRHPLYGYLSEYLAGANEFMAMEKLLQTLSLPDYDRIVLDTPPTRHALDFLQAPERLTEALGGPVLQAIVRAVDETRRFSFDWVTQGVRTVIRSLGRITGDDTLEHVASLLWELSAVFGGFSRRAHQVATAFRHSSFGYVLVTRPVAAAMEDAVTFARVLGERGMRADALVVNRIHGIPADDALTQGLEALRPALDATLHERVIRALHERRQLALAERMRLSELDELPLLAACPRALLPASPTGVARLEELGWLADRLERFESGSAPGATPPVR